jgi:hypothetical protein
VVCDLPRLVPLVGDGRDALRIPREEDGVGHVVRPDLEVVAALVVRVLAVHGREGRGRG